MRIGRGYFCRACYSKVEAAVAISSCLWQGLKVGELGRSSKGRKTPGDPTVTVGARSWRQDTQVS
jgi:hypothetical protein